MPIHRLALPILGMPRAAKRIVVLAVDASLCILTVWLAYYLRLGEWITLSGDPVWRPMWAVGASLLLALPIFIVNGFYRAIFRYAGLTALMTVVKAIGVYGLVYATIFTAFGIPGVPRTIGLIQPVLLLVLVGASRMLARFWLGGIYRDQLRTAALPKVLIYGAGNAGRQLAAAMANSHEMRVIGFLDDDDRLHGHVLNGLAIYSPADLPSLVNTLKVSTVLLAIPSASRHRRNELITRMLQAHVQVRTLPSVSELAQGHVGTSDLRELDIDDLLGREPVPPNHILLGKNIAGKVVMVTGAGGSIGSELCRQILAIEPAVLLLIEQSEFALYEIHQELEKRITAASSPARLVPLLASVRDEERLREIMAAWQPQTVYHAAAYKHVPLVEHNPIEGIRNNSLGTLVAAQVAAQAGVSDFVLVSTDKAVRPTNVMGASKRLAEMVLQALTETHPRTRFSMVRFGNVLGSSGSVVPKFRQQLRDGGPITLTHEGMTRYFMTIPEAAQLVIQAGAMARGGDVFVLDMGEPVRIMDLARRMIELSGLTVRDAQNPEGDIAIQVTGTRPGEKLYEELLIGDNPQPTSHPRIMKAHEEFLAWEVLQPRLLALQEALDQGQVQLARDQLAGLVTGYTPDRELVDWVLLASRRQATAGH
ncbi:MULTISPECIES: polysaccharide biosynthesis protein [Hydrogenophaga]|uniref:Nucleotide sugar epimerase/dehydratase WbpM n=1 Tax=Hydrogenophaga electricum TaxID=1230953 RepID=A0ABQ6C0I8_9BURK|nr:MULTISPECIES: nucleoside-diphosphate sugar epimerase/dehydratase [Hydrogenophaga]GLS13893.1 nucleotide sugar epimerase/dehydratase WbpM [Hydrogenophaga electricum]